jgi:hypothetical protein
MASLTGNKIKDTYTSLLKVGDNGAIDSSAQALTDGAGNALGLTLTNTGVIVSTAKGTLIGTSSTGEVSSTLIADNAVDATRLNVSGNGTNGQSLLSDGDGSFSWGSPSVTIADGSITTAKIAADAVTYAKLGAEFTTAAALSGTSVDWATATTFTKTLSGNTTLTFANVSTGMQINLVISGNHTLTLPSSVKELTNASTYDGSGENLISIVSTNGNTEQFATINKVA